MAVIELKTQEFKCLWDVTLSDAQENTRLIYRRERGRRLSSRSKNRLDLTRKGLALQLTGSSVSHMTRVRVSCCTVVTFFQMPRNFVGNKGVYFNHAIVNIVFTFLNVSVYRGWWRRSSKFRVWSASNSV
jgi:hypothetical protein